MDRCDGACTKRLQCFFPQETGTRNRYTLQSGTSRIMRALQRDFEGRFRENLQAPVSEHRLQASLRMDPPGGLAESPQSAPFQPLEPYRASILRLPGREPMLTAKCTLSLSAGLPLSNPALPLLFFAHVGLRFYVWRTFSSVSEIR